jgi:glycosyltransferase involved in cell wall biosynthesis
MAILDQAARAAIATFNAGIPVIAVVRNEIIRLPAWLAHYRALGTKNFIIVDNGSSDGTADYLHAQADVLLLQTMESFGRAKFGVDWLNEIRAAMPAGNWTVFADADELLVYPGWPARGVDDLAAEIAAAGCDASWAFLLDMYPNGPIIPLDPPMGTPLFEAAPCFDAKYFFRYPPKKPWEKEYAHLDIIGGPRLRSLSSVPRELRATWVDRFLRGQLDRVLSRAPDATLPLLFRLFPQAMPSLFKSPLVRTGADIRYINNHDLAGARYFPRNAVMCHFKFLGDFSKKVHTEIVRKEHYRKGAEYFRYRDILNRGYALDLRCPDTVIFESAAQLEKLGLFIEKSVWPPAPA